MPSQDSYIRVKGRRWSGVGVEGGGSSSQCKNSTHFIFDVI